MPLTLVTGRANTGKTGVLHAALREALAERVPVTLLLPTMPDVRRTEAELGRDGIVGAKIAVLDDWIDELWALYGDGRSIVAPGARRALLQRALADTELRALAPSAATRGLVRLLGDVAQRLTHTPSEQGKGVDAETARVLRRYHAAAAAEGMIERAVAARVLGEGPPRLAGPVLINRFTDLSEAQERFIGGLARLNDVYVALTWEPDLPATAALDPLVERMFASAEIAPRVAAAAESELERLEERLYCPGDPIVAEGRLAVGLAAGDEAECVLAAQAARELVDGGTPPERVAIVFRDAGRRLGLLTAALASEGLVADLDVAVPVSSTPFGAAFAALLDACAAPARDRLLAWLLSPYADAEAADVSAADVGWRRYRVAGERLLRDAATLGPLAARAVASGKRAARGLEASTAGEWRSTADALLAAAVDVLDLLGETQAALGASERAGAVQVTEAHRVRSRRFDAVVLGGLTAEEFSAERQQPLAAEIAERLGATRGMQERDAERMLFYLVATRARHRLVLLRQESDARGEAKRPSVFWDEVVDLYSPEEEDEPPQCPPGIEPRRLGLADLASAAPAYASGRRAQRSQAARHGLATATRGVLRDEGVLASLAETVEFSVTELESYLSCPYRWFYERAVRPRELDVEVDARERGSRAHRLLAAFYKALEPELGVRRVTPSCLEDALQLLDRVGEQVGEEASTRPVGLREELAVAQARQWAHAIVEDDATWLPGYEPAAHEFVFGETAERPFAFGGVALRGSVDRIDREGDALVVTDYKSDRHPKGHASFAGSGLVQLPVYAAATAGLLGLPVTAGLYRSLRSLAARGFRLPGVDLGAHGSNRDELGPEDFETLLEQTAEAIAKAAAGIREGAVAPDPLVKAACAWCAARGLCGGAR